MHNAPNIKRYQLQTSHRTYGFIVMAVVFAIGMAGTTLPTPLYPLYQQHLNISELMVAVIFATYAFGVLGALFVTGPWSDQIGRRPILYAALACAAASSLLFLYGGALWVLLLGRALSGLSAGFFTATATIAVIELAPDSQKTFAAMMAAAANMGGLGLGPLLSGAISQYLPGPLHLAYLVYLFLLVVAGALLSQCPETVTRPSNPNLRPQGLGLPTSVRTAFVPAAIACFAGFALLGLLTSLEPAILGKVVGISNRAAVGGLIFIVFVASLGGQFLQRRLADEVRLPLACGVLVLGAGLLAVSLIANSIVLLIIGAIASGLGQGAIFAASIVAVTAASPAGKRAEITSLLFVVVYLAVAVPVLGLGIAIEYIGLRAAGITFSVLVMLLSIAAVAVLKMRRIKPSVAI
ncbi:MFS transporter [Modicisalibacter radicis]|uniref:MFS transporter n=1 Tax=Halomonas sp. EAR18 TaxID=2518972 RepID=UPI001B35309D|nr:MFS transporter [Halomonas sp. EAR18]